MNDSERIAMLRDVFKEYDKEYDSHREAHDALINLLDDIDLVLAGKIIVDLG